jgi:hypothetical protein
MLKIVKISKKKILTKVLKGAILSPFLKISVVFFGFDWKKNRMARIEKKSSKEIISYEVLQGANLSPSLKKFICEEKCESDIFFFTFFHSFVVK